MAAFKLAGQCSTTEGNWFLIENVHRIANAVRVCVWFNYICLFESNNPRKKRKGEKTIDQIHKEVKKEEIKIKMHASYTGNFIWCLGLMIIMTFLFRSASHRVRQYL